MESRGIRLIRELNGFITGTGTNERMKNEQKRTKARARARAKRVARHNAIGSRTIILYPLCPSPLSLSLPLLPLPPSLSHSLSLSLPSLVFPRNERNTRYSSRVKQALFHGGEVALACFYDQLHTRITVT